MSKESHDISDFDGLEITDEIFDSTNIILGILNDATAPRRKKRKIDSGILNGLKPIDLNHYTYTTISPPETTESKLIDLNHPCYSVPVRENSDLVYECLHEYKDKGIVAEMDKTPNELIRDLENQLEVFKKDYKNVNDIDEYAPPKLPFWKKIRDFFLSKAMKIKIFGENSDEVYNEKVF